MIRRLGILFFIFGALWFAPHTYAQVDFGGIDANELGIAGNVDFRDQIFSVLKTVLGFVGIVAVIVIVVGGALIMTSAGDEKKTAQGKMIIQNGVIGLVVILLSYSIVVFVSNVLTGTSGSGGGEFAYEEGDGDVGSFGGLSGQLIEAVAPRPYATDIPRNTSIQVQFKEPIRVADVLTGSVTPCPAGMICGTLPPNISIKDDTGVFVADDEMYVMISNDAKNMAIVAFDGYALGNDYTPVQYTVTLENIYKSTGSIGIVSYSWHFTVGTYFDNIPPEVISVIPQNSAFGSVPVSGTNISLAPGEKFAKNTVVQVTFSEPISLAGVTGLLVSDSAVHVDSDAKGGLLDGNWSVANGFRSITFLSSEQCADGVNDVINSCGEVVYCLPGSDLISTTVFEHREGIKTGIRDMAGNSLAPTYDFIFETNDELDLEPPVLCNSYDGIPPGDCAVPVEALMNPSPLPEYVTGQFSGGDYEKNYRRNRSVSGRFSKTIMASTVNTNNVYVSLYQDATCIDDPNDPKPFGNCYPRYYTGFGEYKNAEGVVMSDNQRIQIDMAYPFMNPDTEYVLRFTNGIRDTYQNCFYTPTAGSPEIKQEP